MHAQAVQTVTGEYDIRGNRERSIMLQSVMLTIAHNLAAIGSAVAHSPQTALAAMVCAITASLFS
ncbi:hypothetical protein CRX72_29885 [Pantoea sp. BRM17]|nr:hypothetical protein CRX72_29885 [Pantoea sp. BRM17]